MRTAERTIISIVVAGVFSTLLIIFSFIPPAKASPNYFPSFVRGGSNTNTNNKMSADEQPQGLNGMDLIVDGELKLIGGNCTIAIHQFFGICMSHWNVFGLALAVCHDLRFGIAIEQQYNCDNIYYFDASGIFAPPAVSLKIKHGLSNQDCTIAIAVRQFYLDMSERQRDNRRRFTQDSRCFG